MQIKPFIKSVNYNHLMPTRYTLDVDFKSVVTADIVGSTNLTAKSSCRKEVNAPRRPHSTPYAIPPLVPARRLSRRIPPRPVPISAPLPPAPLLPFD